MGAVPHDVGSRSFALVVALLVLASLIVSAAPASAAGLGLPGFGGPPQPAGRISPNGSVVNLADSGLLGYEILNNGDGVFTDQLTAEVINPSNLQRTVTVTVIQFDVHTNYTTERVLNPDGNYTNVTVPVEVRVNVNAQSSSFVVPAASWTTDVVSLPTAANEHHLLVMLDGSAWYLYHHTLPAFITAGTFSVGGVQLIVISVLLVSALITAAIVPIARAVQLRGQKWAPRFRIGIWGPVGTIIGTVIVVNFYAPLDYALNEWIYVIFPALYGIVLFFWLLRFFNRADIRIALKGDPQRGLHLAYLLWERRFTEDEDGELIIVDESWWGWFTALIGYPLKVTRAETEPNAIEGPPHKGQILYEERKRRPKGPSDDFRIRNARPNEPGWLYWVDSDRPVLVTRNKASIHRTVEMEVAAPDGSTHTVKRRKLALPHIVPGSAKLHLAGIHAEHVVSVAMGHIRAEQLSRALEIESLKNTVMRGEIDTRVHKLAQTLMDGFARTMGRPTHQMTPEEAREEIEAWGRTFDPLMGKKDDRKDKR